MIILHRVNTDNRVAIKTIARNESFTRYAIDHDGWSTDDPPPMGISKWYGHIEHSVVQILLRMDSRQICHKDKRVFRVLQDESPSIPIIPVYGQSVISKLPASDFYESFVFLFVFFFLFFPFHITF